MQSRQCPSGMDAGGSLEANLGPLERVAEKPKLQFTTAQECLKRSGTLRVVLGFVVVLFLFDLVWKLLLFSTAAELNGDALGDSLGVGSSERG